MFSSKKQFTIPILALIFVAILAGFWLTPQARAQMPDSATPTVEQQPLRTITVVGRGSVFMPPDVAHTTIGVKVSDLDIKTASQKAQNIIDDVKGVLMSYDVDEKYIQTADYSIYVQESSGRYVVRTSLAVDIHDVEKMGDVMAAAIEAGANDIYGISFSAEDPEEVMAEAREMAVADARARAEELAELHGVAVGDVISISEVIGGGGPMAMPEGLGGGGGGFSPGQLEVSAQLQVVYAILPWEETSVQERPMPPQPAEEPEAIATPVSREPTPAPESMGIEPEMSPQIPFLIIEGGDSDLLRRFISVWLASESLPFLPDETNPRLVLGKLPEDLSQFADIFSDFEVLGVLEQRNNFDTTILLQTIDAPEIAQKTLEQRLLDAGFKKPPGDLEMMGSFGFGSMPVPHLFCNEKDDSLLTVTTAVSREEGTVLSVEINQSDEMMPVSPCDAPGGAMLPPELLLMPHLKAPAGARVLPDGTGGGPTGFYQSAVISVPLALHDVFDHYQQQLQEAGWDIVGYDETKALAWSEGEFKDKKGKSWIGSLFIAKRFSQEDSYFMLVRVERAPVRK